jgi:hypothetical protein
VAIAVNRFARLAISQMSNSSQIAASVPEAPFAAATVEIEQDWTRLNKIEQESLAKARERCGTAAIEQLPEGTWRPMVDEE